MKHKKIIFFLLAALLSMLLATHRWGDSSHAIGIISLKGGKARHPAILENHKDQYTLITTATVIPPFHGNVRVALEGHPLPDYDIYLSRPVLALGIRRLPEFKDQILYNLNPGDRLALWLSIRPHDDMLLNGRYALAFYNASTDQSVLKVPVIFKSKEDMNGWE